MLNTHCCKHKKLSKTMGVTIGFTRMMKKLSCFLKKNAAHTSHIRMMPGLYQRWLPIAIFVRQSKTGSGTCKTHG